MLKGEVCGNLGSDAEIKTFSTGQYVSFSVAHSMKIKGQEVTEWISVLWEGNGGNLLPYLKRGARVNVHGYLSVNLYQDHNGVTQKSINIKAKEVDLLNGARQQDNGQQGSYQQPQPQQQYQQPQYQQPQQPDEMPF